MNEKLQRSIPNLKLNELLALLDNLKCLGLEESTTYKHASEQAKKLTEHLQETINK